MADYVKPYYFMDMSQSTQTKTCVLTLKVRAVEELTYLKTSHHECQGVHVVTCVHNNANVILACRHSTYTQSINACLQLVNTVQMVLLFQPSCEA